MASVAIGDFNRDGKLDVAVGNGCQDNGCTSGSVNILLGNGNGTFQPPVANSLGGNLFSLQAGDLNGDGKLDLVVVNDSSSAGVLLGKGDGTFKPVSTFPTLPGNSAVFLGDFNGDNKLDLAVVTGGCDATPTCARSVNILPGNGDGTFGTPVGSQSAVGLGPQAVALADVNGDRKLDLAVVDACIPVTDTCVNETVDVFLGNGDGTFKSAKSSVLIQSDVTFIGFGDLDGDGKPDLVTVDPSVELASVMLGTGGGRFHPLGSYETEGRASGLAVLADANGDGKTDIAVVNSCQQSFEDPCIGNVLVLLGSGRGTFAGPVTFPIGGSLQSATADFNNDGRPDLALATCGNPDCMGKVEVVLNNTKGNAEPVIYDSGGLFPSAVASGDFNGDGKPDLIVANECVSQQNCAGSIGVLLGKGDGTFHKVVTYSSGGSAPNFLAAGDFNRDGKLDLAVSQCSSTGGCFDGSNGSVGILLGNGDGSFRSAVTYSSGDPFAQGLAIGDFDSDGKLDVAVANGNCSRPDFGLICQTGSVGVCWGTATELSRRRWIILPWIFAPFRW